MVSEDQESIERANETVYNMISSTLEVEEDGKSTLKKTPERSGFQAFIRFAQEGIFNPRRPSQTYEFHNRENALASSLREAVFDDLMFFDNYELLHFDQDRERLLAKGSKRSAKAAKVLEKTKIKGGPLDLHLSKLFVADDTLSFKHMLAPHVNVCVHCVLNGYCALKEKWVKLSVICIAWYMSIYMFSAQIDGIAVVFGLTIFAKSVRQV